MAASPIDWGRAEQVAVAIANRRPPAAAEKPLNIDSRRLEAQIAAVTGLQAPQPAERIALIDRASWIQANIASFREMLRPLLDRFPAQSARIMAVTGQVAGAEVGLLLGWMSTRVLGQYDLLLSEDAEHNDGAVYLVAPNLQAIERRFGFDRRQFRTWVLLHELTHRAQFTGVPWMRGYFHSLVDEGLDAVDPSPQAFFNALKEALNDRREAQRRLRDNGIAGLVATPKQREVLARIGGLMSLLEGHGDVTMTRAAGDLVPHAERFAHVLAERRKHATPLTRLVQRLLGLEAKLDQYAAGERFIGAVEARAGRRAVDLCWQRSGNLPSLDEIRSPELWLDRLDVAAA